MIAAILIVFGLFTNAEGVTYLTNKMFGTKDCTGTPLSISAIDISFCVPAPCTNFFGNLGLISICETTEPASLGAGFGTQKVFENDTCVGTPKVVFD